MVDPAGYLISLYQVNNEMAEITNAAKYTAIDSTQIFQDNSNLLTLHSNCNTALQLNRNCLLQLSNRQQLHVILEPHTELQLIPATNTATLVPVKY